MPTDLHVHARALAVLAVVGGLVACRESARETRVSKISLEPCRLLSSEGLAPPVEAECGRFEVPEDWSKPEGNKISLRVAVVPGRVRPVAPDPIVYITGGPGGASTEDFVDVAPLFARFEDRDVVLVDQRGTGGSALLRCAVDEDVEADEIADALAKCRASLSAELDQYTTGSAVRDLEAVRVALGYERINLYGISYGSRVALEYLARYEANVRTVVLDGIVPREVPLGANVGKDAQRALDLLIARCRDDEACVQHFPRFGAQVDRLFARFEDGPVEVTFAHPVTSSVTTTKMDAAAMSRSLRLLIYAQEASALIPYLVDRAVEHDRLDVLTAHATMIGESLGTKMANAMNLTVLCAEDAPFLGEAEAVPDGKPMWAANDERRAMLESCANWHQAPIAEDFRTPVSSDRPVLLLSGEADPVTPPSNAEHVKQTLSNAEHVVVTHFGHGVIRHRCVQGIAEQFVDRGSVADLNMKCLTSLGPPPFFVDAMGPLP